jgi:hypothetical protein
MRRFIFMAMCIAAATAANAHDWYEDKTDPQTKFKCCGGSDCRAIPRSSVRSRIISSSHGTVYRNPRTNNTTFARVPTS